MGSWAGASGAAVPPWEVPVLASLAAAAAGGPARVGPPSSELDEMSAVVLVAAEDGLRQVEGEECLHGGGGGGAVDQCFIFWVFKVNSAVGLGQVQSEKYSNHDFNPRQ